MNMKERRKYGLQNHQNKYLLVYMLLLFTTSCRNDNGLINFNDVDSIKFWYISKGVCTPISTTDCGGVLDLDPKDTIITDKEVIRRYIYIVNRLKPINPNANYDLKVSSWIKMKKIGKENRQNIGVCIDYLSGRVLKNDTLMQGDKKEIKKFLDEILYDPLPPDAWTFEFMKNENVE